MASQRHSFRNLTEKTVAVVRHRTIHSAVIALSAAAALTVPSLLAVAAAPVLLLLPDPRRRLVGGFQRVGPILLAMKNCID